MAPTHHSGSRGRVCEYYLTPNGCNKGAACSFLHPTGKAAQEVLNNKGSLINSNGTIPGKKNQRCDFYMSRSGCHRGDACPFIHDKRAPISSSSYPLSTSSSSISRAQSLRKPKICSFYNTERGCVKGDHCVFLHVKDKICDFWLSEQGCKKGEYCDFKHPRDEQGQPNTDGIDNRTVTPAANNTDKPLQNHQEEEQHQQAEAPARGY